MKAYLYAMSRHDLYAMSSVDFYAMPGDDPHGKERQVVLHLITGLRTGGAERMLCQLLSAIDLRRWEPVVVSLTDGSAPATWLREQGIPVYTLGMRPGKLPSPSMCLRLIRLIRRTRPVLIHGWMYHANLAAQLAGFFLVPRVPVLWSIHHSPGGLQAEKKMTNGVIRLGARLSRLPDSIVYASQVSRQQHVSLGYCDRKACLIPYGVDPQTYVPSQALKDQVRKELGLPADCVVIGSLARYHPVKDHANFLRAAALLCRRSEGAGVQFVLAGTGVDGSNPVLWALIGELGIGDRIQRCWRKARRSGAFY